jgi:hypothetical protein
MVGRAKSWLIPNVAKHKTRTCNDANHNGQSNQAFHHVPKQTAILKTSAVATLITVSSASIHDFPLAKPQIEAMQNSNWKQQCASNQKSPKTLSKASKHMG